MPRGFSATAELLVIYSALIDVALSSFAFN